MASDKKKSHNYKQNRFTEGYVPGGERIIKVILPDIVNSTPIIVEQNVTFQGVNQVQRITPLVTVNDGDLGSNDTFFVMPLPGSTVLVDVNGLVIPPANGAGEVATAACYFTDSTNTIVRTQGTFQVGDLLHWNGSQAGIQLKADDNVNLLYQI